MEHYLRELIAEIEPLDEASMNAARKRQDMLAKPPHSLGRLEDISVRFSGIIRGITGSAKKRRVLIFSADNGVVDEGVASAPQSVTLMQTINFTRGLTGVATLARHFHTQLHVVDVGVNADFACPDVENRKIAHGTKNIAREAAMTRAEALLAIKIGAETAEKAKRDGIEMIGVGEMGIGNTTTSSAVLSALTGLSPEKTVGRGGGVNDSGFARKREIVAQAIAREKPNPEDPVDVLTKVGGFDLAAMTGAYLGAAHARLPVVIDGYISAVAALCAARLCPLAAQYMFASHASCEAGYARAMEALSLSPMLDLEMRLGEGSGCPIAFEVIDAALTVLREMGTFEQAKIDDGYLAEIRENARLQR